VGAGAERAGRPLAAVEPIAWQALHLRRPTDTDDDRARLRAWAGRILVASTDEVLTRCAIPPSAGEAAREDLRAGGEAALGRRVPDEVVERLLMVGDPEALEVRIRAVRAAGVDTLSFIGFGSTEAIQATFRDFAREVVPRFAAAAATGAVGIERPDGGGDR
jgi:hypothetical protein